MKKSNSIKLIILLFLFLTNLLNADELKWIAIGNLHDWFSSAGCEKETGRRGLITDQLDGMRWPAFYTDKDVKAAKALWIGTTDYSDPMSGLTYDHKVVVAGPRNIDEISGFMPQEFKLIGRFDHPTVIVDGSIGSNLGIIESVDEVDGNLNCDRLLYTKVNTGVGMTMERSVMAFGNQYNDNYFIYDYVFTNTGIYDADGDTQDKTLTDVYFYWQYRYGFDREASAYGPYEVSILPQTATWGRNCMNHVIGKEGEYGTGYDAPIRAVYSWGGTHSQADYADGIGGVATASDYHLTSVQYAGTTIIHADVSTSDTNNDPMQPTNTNYVASDDQVIQYSNDQFDANLMNNMYKQFIYSYPDYINEGHPDKTQAEEIWDSGVMADKFGDAINGSAGGFSQTIAIGPYTIAKDEDIHIVLGEGVSGLSRKRCYKIGSDLKAGDISIDDMKALVATGEDSIIQTLERAVDNYGSDYGIATPPDPPSSIEINSGGDRIVLKWSQNAESNPHFGGYKIYRAIKEIDSTYYLIADYPAGDIVTDPNNPSLNRYDDMSPVRGFNYYYYIVSYDDGTVDPDDRFLSSSLFYTRSTIEAYLKRPPGERLEDIRVVPNPYNIRAQKIQFGEGVGNKDRIMFYNIPPFCKISIFTERGDLIKEIIHDDGSGDDAWNSVTKSRQVVVSGVYVAYFEVTQDGGGFNKGDNIYKKIIIVR